MGVCVGNTVAADFPRTARPPARAHLPVWKPHKACCVSQQHKCVMSAKLMINAKKIGPKVQKTFSGTSDCLREARILQNHLPESGNVLISARSEPSRPVSARRVSIPKNTEKKAPPRHQGSASAGPPGPWASRPPSGSGWAPGAPWGPHGAPMGPMGPHGAPWAPRGPFGVGISKPC